MSSSAMDAYFAYLCKDDTLPNPEKPIPAESLSPLNPENASSNIEKIDVDDDGAVAGPSSALLNPDAEANGTQPVEGSIQGPYLPVWRKKKIEEMNSAEMDEYFRYLCGDDYKLPPPSSPAEMAQRQIPPELLDDADESEVANKPLNEPHHGGDPSPLPRENESDEVEVLHHPVPVPPTGGPIVRRYPIIDVFHFHHFVFVGICPPGRQTNRMCLINDDEHIVPEYCIEMPNPAQATQATLMLRGSIDLFCTLRIDEDLPIESFTRDLYDYLANLNVGGDLQQTGLCNNDMN